MTRKITVSYGRSARIDGRHTGFLYGSGYGLDEELTQCADEAAIALVETFDLPVEKRGNSSGDSDGAYHDTSHSRNTEDGDSTTWFGLGAFRRDGRLRWDALFRAPVADADEIERVVPGIRPDGLWRGTERYPKTHVQVWASFPTLQGALDWLKVWAVKYCPKLAGAAGGDWSAT